jgi:hypothetical protein
VRQHRVGREPAADPQVEPGTVLGVDGPDERHVVDLRGDVVARVTRERRLELARQVGEVGVAERECLDLLQRGRAVDDLVLRDPGDGGPQEGPRAVAARFEGRQADAFEPLPDRRHVLDLDPVVLDVVAVGDVGGVAAVRRRALAERAQLLGSEDLTVGPDAHHEVAVVELLLLEQRGLPAVEARGALGVEAHPAEASTQVGRVDGVEAALGVGVEDPVADVERVVVLLRLLVLVQRLGVAERPLTLGALGARDLGVLGPLGLETQVRHADVVLDR